MKKLSSFVLGSFAIAIFLPACASHHPAQTPSASNQKKDSRYVTSVGRRNIPVYENRGSARIPDQ
jgi:hypothetical protein